MGRVAVASIVVGGLFLAAGCVRRDVHVYATPGVSAVVVEGDRVELTPMPAADAARRDAGRPVLRTEMFESGAVELSAVAEDDLRAFRDDLVQRRNFDQSGHADQPGPSHAYLQTWIDRVDEELVRRAQPVSQASGLD